MNTIVLEQQGRLIWTIICCAVRGIAAVMSTPCESGPRFQVLGRLAKQLEHSNGIFRVSCELGLPPSSLIESIDLSNINQDCITPSFQSSLRVVLENARINLTIHNTYPSGILTQPLLSLLEMVQKPLVNLERQHCQADNDTNLVSQYLTLTALLNVQSISLNYSPGSKSSTSLLNAQNAVRILAIRLRHVFQRLVNDYDSLDQILQHHENKLCYACMPKFMWRHASFAAAALIKLLMDGLIPANEMQDVRDTVRSIGRLLTAHSSHKDDELSTAARLIDLLVKEDVQKTFRLDQEQHPSSQIHTRLGVSVAYDLIYRTVLWRKRIINSTNVSGRDEPDDIGPIHELLDSYPYQTQTRETIVSLPSLPNLDDGLNNEGTLTTFEDFDFNFLASFDDIDPFLTLADDMSHPDFLSNNTITE